MSSSSSKDAASKVVEKRDVSTSPIRQRQPWWKLGGKDVSFVPVEPASTAASVASSSEDDLENAIHGTGQKSVFDDAQAAEFYRPIEEYEGRHRFDPSATWSPEEERKLVRALDWRVCLPICIMFFALQLDRGNITQALSDNMLEDLKITTNDYNNGMTIFYCSFLFMELPSQLVSKKLGPDNWIPIQMVLWSTVVICQSLIHNRTTFYVTRFLLGALEGGFIPDVILYLSYFYKNDELPRRLSFFWSAYAMTSIISSFLAYGILHLGKNGGWEGWRYLFAIEGGLTALLGVLAWFYLPPSPTQTSAPGIKGAFRGRRGWFNDRQEVIMVTRILRDDPGKATMHNRQALSPKMLWEALSDYDMWPIYLLGLSWSIPVTPETSYLTLTLRSLGFSTFNTNLLVIPSTVLFICQLLFWTWLSERVNQRLVFGIVTQLWVIPLLIALECLPAKPAVPWVRYAITTLIVGYPYPHAIIVALTSRNSGTVRTRTVASSIYNMTVQISNIFASQIYRNNDKPLYYKGNKVLLAIAAYNVVAFVGAKFYYIWKNNRRDRAWNEMSREEKLDYLATTKSRGNKRIDFRFAH